MNPERLLRLLIRPIIRFSRLIKPGNATSSAPRSGFGLCFSKVGMPQMSRLSSDHLIRRATAPDPLSILNQFDTLVNSSDSKPLTVDRVRCALVRRLCYTPTRDLTRHQIAEETN